LFREGGFERRSNDPSVLSVKGRLLKDRAIAAKGAERRKFYRESAQAYADAARKSGASYPLINAATLSLLAGERVKSWALARKILERDGDERETPYWRAATRAEAMLLLGDVGDAESMLAHAISLAPRAYEDHASTLRQFLLILDELGQDKAWLEKMRPPRSLHFAGRMAIAANDPDISRKIRELLARERIGHAFGALAAGADLVVAQAVLDADADLHVVLPWPVALFRETSVVPYGKAWTKQFDAVITRASSVCVVSGDGPASPLSIELAADVAMGSAVMNARTFMSEAVQLLILQKGNNAGTSASIGAIWKSGGRRQDVLVAPKRQTRNLPRQEKAKRSEQLAALVRLEIRADIQAARLDEILFRIAGALRDGQKPLQAPFWTGDAVVVGFATPLIAATAIAAIAKALSRVALVRIAAHYGVLTSIRDPFAGGKTLTGAAMALAARIAASVPEGAVCVSESFAAALCAADKDGRFRLENVGELQSEYDHQPAKLFSLKF